MWYDLSVVRVVLDSNDEWSVVCTDEYDHVCDVDGQAYHSDLKRQALVVRILFVFTGKLSEKVDEKFI